MLALQMMILALTTSAAPAPDLALLDFYADWCGPCRQMDPIVKQLAAAGYPVRQINIDHDQALAAKFQVRSIPCFVLTVGGREVTRTVGATSMDELKQMFAQARAEAARAGSGDDAVPDVRGQSPDPPTRSVPMPGSQAEEPLASGPAPRSGLPAGLRPSCPATPAGTVDRLMAASVRLKVDDPNGHSYGSGTIIDVRGDEALVLTCGHLFRDSHGKGPISADLYGRDGTQTVEGRLVEYDAESDVGLVRIRTDAPLKAIPVAPPGYEVRSGDAVISIGCNNGEPPTARESQVTGINKFLGPANLQVAGQPVSGRSGGGLFSAEGYVIGVCNAADPTDNEGLYAALASIHGILDKSHLEFVYQPAETGDVADASEHADAPTMPERMPAFAGRDRLTPAAQRTPPKAPVQGHETPPAGLSGEEEAALSAIREQAPTAEVICIIRSLTNPRAKSEIIVLDKASPEFLDQLSVEEHAQDARHVTSLSVSQPGGPIGEDSRVDGGESPPESRGSRAQGGERRVKGGTSRAAGKRLPAGASTATPRPRSRSGAASAGERPLAVPKSAAPPERASSWQPNWRDPPTATADGPHSTAASTQAASR